jgi:predicted XRE-type DNA-binding protein
MDRLPRRGTASSLSRIRAATLRPVVRASCLNRRSVVSGSFTVIPFIITYHGNPILTEWQYRALGLLGQSVASYARLGMWGQHPDAQPLRSFGGAGILEIVEDHTGDTYRPCTGPLGVSGVSQYVLHAFQKKSKSGIQTPRVEIELIKSRLKRAEEEHIRARRLTQTRAAHILRIHQPKISRLLRGQLSGFSTERLMHFLTLFGRDVEITVNPAPRSHHKGHLRVVATG